MAESTKFLIIADCSPVVSLIKKSLTVYDFWAAKVVLPLKVHSMFSAEGRKRAAQGVAAAL